MNESIIISFAGMAQSFLKIHPQEFRSFLSKSFPEIPNIFFSDASINLYQGGMDIWNDELKQWEKISNNIDESVEYIKDICKNYKNIYFVGASIGGYMAILTAYLINQNNIRVLAYYPQLRITDKFHEDIEQYFDRSKFDQRYLDLSNLNEFNSTIIIVANSFIEGRDAIHSIDYPRKLSKLTNVTLIEHKGFDMKEHRDSGGLLNDFLYLMS